jgi:hypothetical protein
MVLKVLTRHQGMYSYLLPVHHLFRHDSGL